MKVYIAGPMTGYVEHNFPAFNAAAEHLRSLGYQVVNPAEMDDPNATHEELAAVPHEFYMRRDLELLLECDAIYLLPGWAHSRGASLEAKVAEETGILRLEEHNKELWRTFEGTPITEEPSGYVAEICEPKPQVFDINVETDDSLPPGVMRVMNSRGETVDIDLMPSYMAEYLAAHGNAIDDSIQQHHRKGA